MSIRMPDAVPLPVPLDTSEETASETRPAGREIPLVFCCLLLGISAAILIIQIWTYFS